MWKYILAAFAIIVAWSAILVFKLPYWYAIVATAVILLALGTAILVIYLKKKKAEKALEKAVVEAAPTAGMSPEQRAKIAEMQAEFAAAVEALKRSAVGRRGQSLQALPWYVIIGPPGAGKSTAIRNSGLPFPYLSASGQGGAVQGLGGTLNCDWWMSNQGIILDTAGRYSTQHQDREEWQAFLDIIGEHRPKQPINGVMVAVSSRDLMAGDSEMLTELARTLRSRVDELSEKLGCSAPVYVLITMADLIPGFVESFAPLGKSERQGPWGFSFPIERPNSRIAEQCLERFDALCASLHERCVRRVTEHGGDSEKGMVYAFARNLAQQRSALATFMQAFASASVYSEAIRVRGVYWTSGTQETAAFDQMMGAAGQAMGLAMPAQAAAETESRSYFLGGLFTHIIFPDRGFARRSQAFLAKQRKRHWIAAAILFALSALIIGLPMPSAKRNRSLQHRLAGTLKDLQADSNEAPAFASEASQRGWRRLVHVDDQLESLEGGLAVGHRFGMYQGGKLRPASKKLFIHLSQRQWVDATVHDDLATLRRFVDRYEPQATSAKDDSFRLHLQILRRYLLMTGPAEAIEPSLDGPEGEWLTDSLTVDWAANAQEELGDDQALVPSIAAKYINYMIEDPSLRGHRDLGLVNRVRTILLRTDRDKALVWSLIDEAAPLGLDIGLRNITTSQFFQNEGRVVRGAFTRRGWEELIRERLEEEVNKDDRSDWILGTDKKQAQAQRELRMARLRHYYFEAFHAEWDTFLRSLRVQAPAEPEELLKMLAELSSAVEAPYRQLCEYVRWNTNLEEKIEEPEPQDEMLDKALEAGKDAAGRKINRKTRGKGKGILEAGLKKRRRRNRAKGDRQRFLGREDLAQKFEAFYRFGSSPPPAGSDNKGPRVAAPTANLDVDVYEEQLRSLKDALRAYIADTTKNKELYTISQAAENRVEGLIDDQPTEWRLVFSELLRPPLITARNLVRGDTAIRLQEHWCNKVVFPFEDLFLSRYPFNAQSGEEVLLADVNKYLHPDTGELWQEIQEFYTPYILREHGQFVAVDRGEHAEHIVSPEVMEFLDAAWDLTRSLFPRGKAAPFVEMEVEAKARSMIQQTRFDLDGQSYTYDNGPRKIEVMVWPGATEKPGAVLRARFKNGRGDVSHRGEWGFFRLLEAGRIDGDSQSPTFMVSWNLQENAAGASQMVFRPLRDIAPFYGPRELDLDFMGIFRRGALTAPQALFQGGTLCIRP